MANDDSQRDTDNRADQDCGEIADIGVVIIGRNEGERLMGAIDALLRAGAAKDTIVYVDSGSTDGSIENAKARGIHALPTDAPHTAAKGRNAGARFLIEKHPGLFAIQFVDGDCEYFPAWLQVASTLLRNDDGVVAVTGLIRERRPDASVYNLLIDVEWTGVVGDVDVFAGNVMLRADAYAATTGYNEDLIAGEDPEFSIRVRKTSGKRIARIDEPMCLHDVEMTKLSQWWRRNLRAGHAFAQVNRLHGEAPLSFWKKETRSNWLWGAVLPVAAPVLVPPAYATLFWRIYSDARRRGMSAETARAYAFFTTLGKVPQALGQMKYWWNTLRGEKSTLIEYKGR
jgi:GT2 family glycosyltransferase